MHIVRVMRTVSRSLFPETLTHAHIVCTRHFSVYGCACVAPVSKGNGINIFSLLVAYTIHIQTLAQTNYILVLNTCMVQVYSFITAPCSHNYGVLVKVHLPIFLDPGATSVFACFLYSDLNVSGISSGQCLTRFIATQMGGRSIGVTITPLPSVSITR